MKRKSFGLGLTLAMSLAACAPAAPDYCDASGIRVDGRAEQNLGEEEGVEEIRNRDRFPDAPWPADPGALPGGGS